jgi:choline dehydrogenase
LTLRSPNVADKPVIRANYLTAPSDIRIMLESAKLGRRIAATEPFAGLIESEQYPGPNTDSEDEMLDYIRGNGTTVYHPCGTNRMGTDQRSVVDEELRVRGVQGLRVVDASVFPLVPSSNIHPAVLMLAERASDLIRRVA